ncbi:Os07g0416100 [Oryza sativa Japonica Group]|jgi:WRKY transcription factor 33|nr:hypothetical protein EE612_038702 [Oryza sativa]BAC80037.1 unknown protein [Oryza sativa Japonica Group]BAF21378.1 Os07g0416100 [Oryza sativa Japonica Group]BAT01148.1 Os07g0416100 [Oryza sativa Japonica Group]|eukprot:NP_001059464.1 Os07g0416100 [Oryza sativa Japonica Group]
MPLRAASFSTCRNTSSGCVAADCADDLAAPSGAGTDQYSAVMPENSSVTFGDDEADNGSHRSEGDEPEAKR